MMRYFVECGLFVVVVVLPYGICMLELSAEIHAVTLCPICGAPLALPLGHRHAHPQIKRMGDENPFVRLLREQPGLLSTLAMGFSEADVDGKPDLAYLSLASSLHAHSQHHLLPDRARRRAPVLQRVLRGHASGRARGALRRGAARSVR